MKAGGQSDDEVCSRVRIRGSEMGSDGTRGWFGSW
jgi:hypothetical protein